MTRRSALYLLFGGAIIGALSSSYLHLAAWLRPWMPPGWTAASYVAALSIDGLIMAPIVARQIVGGPVPGLALPLAQWLGIVASVYVNARWGAANVRSASWADIGVGAAILPLFALAAEHAMRVTLAALQDREAQKPRPARVPATRKAPRASTVTAAAPALRQQKAEPVADGGRTKAAAVAAIMAEQRCSERTAYRRLADMKATGGAV
jgi:hypothetical protein